MNESKAAPLYGPRSTTKMNYVLIIQLIRLQGQAAIRLPSVVSSRCGSCNEMDFRKASVFVKLAASLTGFQSQSADCNEAGR